MSHPSAPQNPRAGVSQRSPAPQYHVPQPQAPTLLQFWRSDSRIVPGRRRPRWAGLIAFWLGLASFGLLVAEMFLDVGDGYLGAVGAPLSMVAGFFAIVAIVAGVGRGLGILGAILAILGNVYVWGWASEAFA